MTAEGWSWIQSRAIQRRRVVVDTPNLAAVSAAVKRPASSARPRSGAIPGFSVGHRVRALVRFVVLRPAPEPVGRAGPVSVETRAAYPPI